MIATAQALETGCMFSTTEAISGCVWSVSVTLLRSAVQWIVGSMSDDGRIPYVITPTDRSPTTYQPITYSTESFIDVDLRYNSPQTKALLAPLKKTVLWLAHNQSADGSWGYIPKPPEHGLLGFSASGDAQRSPRALSLLQWHLLRTT
jgi:hypothetical protein